MQNCQSRLFMKHTIIHSSIDAWLKVLPFHSFFSSSLLQYFRFYFPLKLLFTFIIIVISSLSIKIHISLYSFRSDSDTYYFKRTKLNFISHHTSAHANNNKSYKNCCLFLTRIYIFFVINSNQEQWKNNKMYHV